MSEAVALERAEERSHTGRTTPREREREREREPEVSTGELLGLLDAEYTRTILEEAGEGAKSARAIAEACGASRATVYRRLDCLQDVGLVETGMEIDADGHHRTVFESTLESVSVDVTEEGLSTTVTTSAPEQVSTSPAPRTRH